MDLPSPLTSELSLEHHQAVVEVGGDLATRKLEDFRRVHGDDVADVLRHDEGVCGCCGLNRGDAGESGGGQGQKEAFKSCFHDVFSRVFLFDGISPGGPG
jgi:hypothetical protein